MKVYLQQSQQLQQSFHWITIINGPHHVTHLQNPLRIDGYIVGTCTANKVLSQRMVESTHTVPPTGQQLKPPPWSPSLTEQRKTELPRDKHSFRITIHISFLQVNTVNQEGNIIYLQQALPHISLTLSHSVLFSSSPSEPSHTTYTRAFTLRCRCIHCSPLRHEVFQQETKAHQMAREIKQ